MQPKPSPNRSQGGPDFQLVRNQNIFEFLRWQHIPMRGHSARCWRHDDQHFSVAILSDRNKVRCEVCSEDIRGMSNIDVLMQLQPGLSEADAARQIARHFDLPIKERSDKKQTEPDFRALNWMIDRGYLATIRASAAKILLVLMKYLRADQVVEISYGKLMQQSGVGSEGTVRNALNRFAADGWLVQWNHRAQRDTGYYELKWDNQRFKDLVAQIEVEHYRQAEAGIQKAREKGKRRRAQKVTSRSICPSLLPEENPSPENLPSLPIPRNTLDTSNTPSSPSPRSSTLCKNCRVSDLDSALYATKGKKISPESVQVAVAVCTQCSNDDFVTAVLRENDPPPSAAAIRRHAARRVTGGTPVKLAATPPRRAILSRAS